MSNPHLVSRHKATQTTAANSVTSTFDNLPDTGYVRQKQLIPHVVPISSATLWRGVVSGKFPRPVKLSERVTAWRVADIRQWLEAKAVEVSI